MKLAYAHQIVWLKNTDDGPLIHEDQSVPGPVAEAISFAKSLAKEANFVMAQVLAENGRVIANIAPGGISRMN
jgi:hypothetical protein